MSYIVFNQPILGTLTIGGDRFVFEASLDSPEVVKFGLLACQLAIFLSDITCAKLLFSNQAKNELEHSTEITYQIHSRSPTKIKKEINENVVKKNSWEEGHSDGEGDKENVINTRTAVFCASLETIYRLQKYLKRSHIKCLNFEENSLALSDSTLQEICQLEEHLGQQTQLFETPVLNTESKILTEDLLKVLSIWLPERFQFSSTWYLVYGTAKHGISLNTFYRRMETYCDCPSICIIKTSRGENFWWICIRTMAKTRKLLW